MSVIQSTPIIGQPPRANRGAFDTHEAERWFDDLYRYLKVNHTATTSIINHLQVTASAGDGGTGSGGGTTIIEEKSKRYLRWLGM